MSLSGKIRERIRTSTTVHNLKEAIWDIFVNGLLASWVMPRAIRNAILNCWCHREILGSVSPHVYIQSRLFSLGRHSYINRFSKICNGSAPVQIGNNCAIAFDVTFCTDNHDYASPVCRGGKVTGKAIVVEDGVWIGASCTILPGVRIGSGCVIGAGSVISKDCVPHSLYVGNPAVKIKDLPQ